MTILFIADLHLEDSRASTTELFRRFVREVARGARALYILGDLFEAWVGDDDPAECGRIVATELAALAAAGTNIGFIHGNRDFLLGHDYAARCGMRLLPDPAVIVADGAPLLIGHGDALCTDDHAYQAFRAQTRDSQWRSRFLAQPLQARVAFAQQARDASRARHGELQAAGTAETITDVAPDAVSALFLRSGIPRLVHGHTHRPAVHEAAEGTRVVVGDWHDDRTRYARAEGGRIELLPFA